MLVEDGRQRFSPSVFYVSITKNPFLGTVFELKATTTTTFEQKVEVVLHKHECCREGFLIV